MKPQHWTSCWSAKFLASSAVKDSGSTILISSPRNRFRTPSSEPRGEFLEHGKIVEQKGTPQEVIDNPKMPQTQEFPARVFTERPNSTASLLWAVSKQEDIV